MAANYVLLERIELLQYATSLTFSNIPQSGYTDLKIVASTRDTQNGGGTSGAWDNFYITFNGSSSNIFSRWLTATDGSSIGSGNSSSNIYTFSTYNGATANTFASTEFYIPNYTSSNYKSLSIDTVTENNGTAGLVGLTAGLWSDTSPITSITFTPNGGNWYNYSTFSLYGLAATGTTPVISPKATGGNSVITNGTYWYHTFFNSGTFIPTTSLTCDYLVIAGGGGGGGNLAGGGGAGGLIYASSQSLSSTVAYAIAVGAGGAGSATGGPNGIAGSNSTLGVLATAIGGGAGQGDGFSTVGLNGGSGGGGSRGSGTYGTGTSGQGYNGSEGSGVQFNGGGGGGAGGAGGRVTSNPTGGAGGVGLDYSTFATATSTGSSGYYAGGGGGGAGNTSHPGGGGGTGGGGTGGGSGGLATAGVINTGSGGGGGGWDSNSRQAGAAGASGIVIIRYPV